MSVSAVAPTPFYQDPERLPIGLPQASARGSDKAESADARSEGGKHLSMFAAGDDEPSFWDLLDVINPLQHIPVISNLYREMTGDQIGVGARLVGGTLFGGPLGLIASAADCVVEESTGMDTGGHVLALFRDEGQSSPGEAPATQLAQTSPTPNINASTPAATDAVSSSPAKVAAADSAPIITLPEGKGAGASQPMVFSLDGVQGGATAPVPAPEKLTTADEAGVTIAATQVAATTAKPLPLQATSAKGFMPVPPRAAPSDVKPAPPITTPTSSSMSRSNVPVTGRSPQATAAFATAQRAQVSPDALAGHPMMPPTDANGQTAAGPDWFSTAWGQALDKYQRANQRNDKAAGGSDAASSTLQ